MKQVMPYKTSKILLLAGFLLLWSEQRSLFAATAVKFIYAQGFYSCSRSHDAPLQEFHKNMQDIRDSLGQAEQAESLHAEAMFFCFDGGFIEHPSDSTERLFFRRHPSLHAPLPPLQEWGPREAPNMLANLLEREARALAQQGYEMPMRVHIAGHSHGAWLAQRIVAALGHLADIQVDHLLTIDPISYDLCPSAWFGWNVLRNTVPTGLAKIDDCHRAPQDLRHISQLIRQVTSSRWTNIYQSTMPYLHSGPILEATSNIDIPWIKTFDYWTGHRAILRDPRTWMGFHGGLKNRVKTSLNLPIHD